MIINKLKISFNKTKTQLFNLSHDKKKQNPISRR